MPVFSGNITSNATSTAYPSPTKIVSFSLANKTGGNVDVSVGIFYGSSIAYILYQKQVVTKDSYIYLGEEILVPANYQIYIAVSGSTDYYFTLKDSV